MATGRTPSSTPKRAKRCVRHQLQLSFPSEELRDSFLTWLEHAKKLLFPRKSVANAQFMNTLLAKLDRLESQSVDGTQQQQSRVRLFLVLQSLILLVSLLHTHTYIHTYISIQ